MNPGGGVQRATVISATDPLGLGRVLIRLSDGVTGTEVWARIASPPQSARGIVTQFEVSDEVLVAFAGGDSRSPVVIGNLWQGGSAPPTQASTNPVRGTLTPQLPSRKVK